MATAPSLPVLDEPRLVYEYKGPNAEGGWTVFDAADHPVGRVQTPGFFSGDQTYRLGDEASRAVLAVSYLNPGIIAQSGLPLAVLDAGGNELGRFEPPGLNTHRESVYVLVTRGARVGQLTVTHTSSAVTDASLADQSGARVATIGQGHKRMGLFKSQRWFTLEREAAPADPMRLFAVGRAAGDPSRPHGAGEHGHQALHLGPAVTELDPSTPVVLVRGEARVAAAPNEVEVALDLDVRDRSAEKAPLRRVSRVSGCSVRRGELRLSPAARAGAASRGRSRGVGSRSSPRR